MDVEEGANTSDSPDAEKSPPKVFIRVPNKPIPNDQSLKTPGISYLLEEQAYPFPTVIPFHVEVPSPFKTPGLFGSELPPNQT